MMSRVLVLHEARVHVSISVLGQSHRTVHRCRVLTFRVVLIEHLHRIIVDVRPPDTVAHALPVSTVTGAAVMNSRRRDGE